MTHLCYIYIENYKKLRQVGIVIDPHYQYNLNIQVQLIELLLRITIVKPPYFKGA